MIVFDALHFGNDIQRVREIYLVLFCTYRKENRIQTITNFANDIKRVRKQLQ